MVEEESSLSTVLGVQGWYASYGSVEEFTENLNEANLSSEKFLYGLVCWTETDELQGKIVAFLSRLASSLDLLHLLGCCVVQFWAPSETDEGRLCLTTSTQPFAVFSWYTLYKGQCWYRKQSRDDVYYFGAEEKDDAVGPIGHVFRTGLPESSPDLRLYSAAEHPFRDQAARCHIRSFIALPLFDTTNHYCVGVLEITSLYGIYRILSYMRDIASALEVAGLGLRDQVCFSGNTEISKYKAVESEITNMLQLAMKILPQILMAQVWVNCNQDGSQISSTMQLAGSIHSEEYSQDVMDGYQWLGDFVLAQNLHHLQTGKGIVGRVLHSRVKACLCLNICDFSISDFPMAHYAQQARLTSCFAICLRSKENGNDLFVLEFFVHNLLGREDEMSPSLNSVRALLRISKEELKSFEVASGEELGDKLEVEVLSRNEREYNSTQSAIIAQEKDRHCNVTGFSIKVVFVDFQENDSTLITKLDECYEVYNRNEVKDYLEEPSGWSFGRSEYKTAYKINSSANNQIERKIFGLLRKVMKKFDCTYYIAQYWAPSEDGSYLTTTGHSFAIGALHKGLCWYRKQCMSHYYILKCGDMVGPPGRAFLNAVPESSPDLLLYSNMEFPLRQDAVLCGLRGYAVLPVFDLSRKHCVGVLEFATDSSHFGLQIIDKVFKKETLGFEKPYRKIFKGQEQALKEIWEMISLSKRTPHFYAALVWAPCSVYSNSSCMELKKNTSTLSNLSYLFGEATKLLEVQRGRGIVGRALESKNKSCYCRNSSNLSIADHPLAHYLQKERLDNCFAICLKSSYSGDDLYAIEFCLLPGHTGMDYFCSFLNLLMPIMKRTLNSFKLASGGQIGDELVIDVIEFGEYNQFTYTPNFGQPQICPFRFEIIPYSPQQVRSRQVGNGQADLTTDDAANTNENIVTISDDEGTTGSFKIPYEDLEPHFGKKLEIAAKELGVGRSTVKRACRRAGIFRWPSNDKYKKNPKLYLKPSAIEAVGGSEEEQRASKRQKSTTKNRLDADVNPESNVGRRGTVPVVAKDNVVVVKVAFEDATSKIWLSIPCTLETLKQEISRRHTTFRTESFILEYEDADGDWILLSIDEDLGNCIKVLTESGKMPIKIRAR